MAVQSPSSRHEGSGAAQTHAYYVLHAPILKGGTYCERVSEPGNYLHLQQHSQN
jgi:hypothetical protein